MLLKPCPKLNAKLTEKGCTANQRIAEHAATRINNWGERRKFQLIIPSLLDGETTRLTACAGCKDCEPDLQKVLALARERLFNMCKQGFDMYEGIPDAPPAQQHRILLGV